MAEISGEKVLAAREEQGRVLFVVILLRCTKQLPHADWLNDAQRVNVKPAVVNLVFYIMVSYAVRCMLITRHMRFLGPSGPLCLSSCHLAQLSSAPRAEYRHDAEATIKQYHRVCDKSSH